MSGLNGMVNIVSAKFILDDYNSGLFDPAGEGAAGLTRVFEWLFGKDKGDAKLDSLNFYGYSPAL